MSDAKDQRTELAAIAEIRGVRGVYEIDHDGFLLSSIDSGGVDAEAVAAAAANFMVSCERMGEMLDLGAPSWMIMEFKKGKMILVRHKNAIHAATTGNTVMLGDIVQKLHFCAGLEDTVSVDREAVLAS